MAETTRIGGPPFIFASCFLRKPRVFPFRKVENDPDDNFHASAICNFKWYCYGRGSICDVRTTIIIVPSPDNLLVVCEKMSVESKFLFLSFESSFEDEFYENFMLSFNLLFI